MDINGNSRIREILQHCPHADAIFDSSGVSYFGHDQSLDEACAEAKVTLARVVRQLQQDCDEEIVEEQRDWDKAPLLELTQHIVQRHHEFAKESLQELDRHLQPAVEVHCSHAPAVVRIKTLFDSFKESFVRHMLEEEQVMFPYIERLEEASHTDAPIQPPYFGKLAEHAKEVVLSHGTSIATLQEIMHLASTAALPSECHDALEEFLEEIAILVTDTARHIELENTILLPRALNIEGAVESRFSILGELW